MDDAQLCDILDLGCHQPCHVGTCFVYACDRLVLVRTVLILGDWLTWTSQAAGTTSNSNWAHHHCRHHGAERHRWSPASRTLPRPQSLIVWLLVELFQRHQSRRFGYVLVRHSDLRWFGVRLPGAFDLTCTSSH